MTRQRALRLAREWSQWHTCSLRYGEVEEYHSMFAAMLEESMPNEPLTIEQLRASPHGKIKDSTLQSICNRANEIACRPPEVEADEWK